eukprot:6178501-Pleurochrysis_carterae.AAC.1
MQLRRVYHPLCPSVAALRQEDVSTASVLLDTENECLHKENKVRSRPVSILSRMRQEAHSTPTKEHTPPIISTYRPRPSRERREETRDGHPSQAMHTLAEKDIRKMREESEKAKTEVFLELLHDQEDDGDTRDDAAEVGPEAVVKRHEPCKEGENAGGERKRRRVRACARACAHACTGLPACARMQARTCEGTRACVCVCGGVEVAFA